MFIFLRILTIHLSIMKLGEVVKYTPTKVSVILHPILKVIQRHG